MSIAQLTQHRAASGTGAARAAEVAGPERPRRTARVTLRPATPTDAETLHTLIAAHAAEGRLLPRHLDELATHASRFVVAVRRRVIVGCAELAPLSRRVAEIRSLVVSAHARGSRIGGRLIGELQQQARREGFATLCAFTHDPSYFVRLGFSIVPHAWVPEKIAHDCVGCAQFRRCGQSAVAVSLERDRPQRAAAPGLASVGG